MHDDGVDCDGHQEDHGLLCDGGHVQATHRVVEKDGNAGREAYDEEMMKDRKKK